MKNLVFGITFVCAILSCASARPQGIAWVRQFGTETLDEGYGVSSDALGNVFVGGATLGDLAGPSNGYFDAYVTKYDTAGLLHWTRQFGAEFEDRASAVAADGTGGVYVTGATEGNLGAPSSGGFDAFLQRYDGDGVLRWSSQLGDFALDASNDVATDGFGGVIITGTTEGELGSPNAGNLDAFVSKYDSGGDLLWTRQQGSPGNDEGTGVAIDSTGNIYVAGTTDGKLGDANHGGLDAFISKYAADGTLQWTTQLAGTSTASDIAIDGLGNIFLTGSTKGNPGLENLAYLTMLDADGILQWSDRFGGPDAVLTTGVTTDGLGHVYVAGGTESNIEGQNTGESDAFVVKYDSAGTYHWAQQFGSTAAEQSLDVSADGFGNIFLVGATEGNLSGANAGAPDAFVARIVDLEVPEPAGLVLSVLSIVGAIFMHRRALV